MPKGGNRVNADCHPERAAVSYGRCGSCAKMEEYRKDPPYWNRLRRLSHLKTRYGIMGREADELETRREGLCDICGHKCPTGKRLAVDHDHETNKVRGVLCMNCNTAIGMLRDDPDLIRKVAAYLEIRG
jgi:epoxyqueuosine reductase QueG